MSDLFQDPLPVRMVADDPSKPEVLFERPLPVYLPESSGSEVDDAKIAALLLDENSQTRQALDLIIEEQATRLG